MITAARTITELAQSFIINISVRYVAQSPYLETRVINSYNDWSTFFCKKTHTLPSWPLHSQKHVIGNSTKGISTTSGRSKGWDSGLILSKNNSQIFPLWLDNFILSRWYRPDPGCATSKIEPQRLSQLSIEAQLHYHTLYIIETLQ